MPDEATFFIQNNSIPLVCATKHFNRSKIASVAKIAPSQRRKVPHQVSRVTSVNMISHSPSKSKLLDRLFFTHLALAPPLQIFPELVIIPA